MSHEITKIDSLLVPQGQAYRTWHGLEHTSPNTEITLQEVEDLGIHPTVIEGRVTANTVNGEVDMKGYKSLISQTRDGDLHPLHIAKDGYQIIQNSDVWNTMTKAFEGVGIENKITCVGTLGGHRRYFISVAVGENGGGFEVNGDQFFGNLNFVTSHDGTQAFRAFDSLTRVVCENTLQWAVNGEKNMDFKMYHKGDVKPIASSLGKYINSILTGREVFQEAMEKFHAIQVADSDVEKIVGGYFLINNPVPQGKTFSTRTENAINEISRLSRSGLGQDPTSNRNLYDVMNGATEYYTSGDGVGVTSSDGKKAYSSEFGTASKHKVDFVQYLNSNRYEVMAEKAGEVLALTN